MFRKTLITAALASVTFFALGSAAQASTEIPECFFDPAGCDRIVIDTQEEADSSIFDLGLSVELHPEILEVVPDTSVDIAPIEVPDMSLPPFDFGDVVIPGPVDEDPAEEPAEEPAEDPAEGFAEEPVDEPTTTTVAPVESVSNVEATSSDGLDDGTQATTTVAAESADGEADAAMTGTGTGGTFDPIMAAVFGALGALAVALLTLTGFIAGRRS